MLPCATLLLTCPIPTQIKRQSILYNNYHCVSNSSMPFPLLTVALPLFAGWDVFAHWFQRDWWPASAPLVPQTPHDSKFYNLFLSFSCVAVPPLGVKILGENKPFSAETKYNVSCQVVGARPPPRITWLKGGQHVRSSKRIVSGINIFVLDMMTAKYRGIVSFNLICGLLNSLEKQRNGNTEGRIFPLPTPATPKSHHAPFFHPRSWHAPQSFPESNLVPKKKN